MKSIEICTEDKGSKLHRLFKKPSEIVVIRSFEISPTEKLYFAHWTISWQKINPKTASHTLIISKNTSVELEKNDRKKTKFIALTDTWLTKSDTEPKKQWKTGRDNLKESHGIAKCSPLLSIPRDTDRKTGGPGYLLLEPLTHKGIEYP